MSRLSEISFEPLEPYDGKLSCTVLRGERGSNAPDLPDITDKLFPAEPLTLIYYNMIEIEQWGKMIIWLWSRYIKKKPIPYIDLEFHYPMWMFYLVGGILGGLILGIALFYFTIIN